jgi:TRAP-type mannitol/chloroaromatic compound transport system permease large subunit
MGTTTKLSSFVMFILIGATIFSMVFQGGRRPGVGRTPAGQAAGRTAGFPDLRERSWCSCWRSSWTSSSCPSSSCRCSAPIADKMGIDLVWFGVLLAMNMQTSFMHPPFGFALFYLRSVAPGGRLHRQGHQETHQEGHNRADLLGSVPFVLIQIIMVGLIIAFPGIVSHKHHQGPGPSMRTRF